MISDFTVYGYVGDGFTVCTGCVTEASRRYAVTGDEMTAYDTQTDGRLDGLLSIHDDSEEGLTCDECGGYIFEPSASYLHEQGAHDEESERDCDACTAIENQLDEWLEEHEAGDHAAEPILSRVTVRDRWATAVTRGGCPACEAEHAPVAGQLELHPANRSALPPGAAIARNDALWSEDGDDD